ncbi:zinc-binding dehydrogenase [Streptosporangium sp. NPDC087985]|uniref:zinc-binding dehydrogenase n=1 Tax=Streptosporangium sp. NPDC087985 TaxID=3366196 RepID=UPI00381A431E
MVEIEQQSIRLARKPLATVRPDDFAVVDELLPPVALAAGEVEVRPECFGLNAGLRSRLATGRSTTLGPAVDIGDVPASDAVARVTRSRDGCLPVGTRVVGLLPWASRSAHPGTALTRLGDDVDDLRALTLLGHAGLTAYVGLVAVGGLKRGETVWISAAAGGVGTCAVQLARALGAKVVASASGARRLSLLREDLDLPAVMDRRNDLDGQLERLAPEGLDLYLDLVGGNHLRQGIAHLRDRGRVVLMGRSGGVPHRPVLEDSSDLIRRRLTLIGMSVTDHPEARCGLEALVREADESQSLKSVATVYSGMRSLPHAFAALLRGDVLGRALVRCSGESDALEPAPAVEMIR